MASRQGLIQAVRDYAESADAPFLDIEFVDDGDTAVRELLGPRGPELFSLVFKHTSDSLICVWHPPGDKRQPITWLDVQGSPLSVFADSPDDLLSLLCYGAGFITDALARCEARGVMDSGELRDDLEFSDEQLRQYLERVAGRHPGYPAFRSWLEREHGITPMRNPCRSVASTLLRYPRLEPWLREQGLI
jgi:hypothetical protein